MTTVLDRRLPLALAASFLFACSSKETPATASSPDAAPADAGACEGSVATGAGETCIGYGPGDTCPASCGQPFGYVCFGGPPPGFEGCRETRTSDALGNSYCCPKNDCVAQPDQDESCASKAGTPHRYQCPPDESGGNVAPPSGCVESGSGGSNVEKFYCCP